MGAVTSAHRQVSVDGCRLLDLPRVQDRQGNLTFIEQGRHIPFELRRVFYLYDVPGGETRAGHANRDLEQVIIAASGSFDVIVDDGAARRTYRLNRSYVGLYVPGMLWREIENFSSGSVCLVLASDYYDAADYVRDYDEYRSTMARARATDGAADAAGA
jgi:hypothetical protein